MSSCLLPNFFVVMARRLSRASTSFLADHSRRDARGQAPARRRANSAQNVKRWESFRVSVFGRDLETTYDQRDHLSNTADFSCKCSSALPAAAGFGVLLQHPTKAFGFSNPSDRLRVITAVEYRRDG